MDEPGVRRPNPGRIVELLVADAPDSWAAAGFTVTGDAVILSGVRIRLTGEPADGPRGITGWTLSGLAIADGTLDGLPTGSVETAIPGELPDDEPPAGTAHPNGAIGIDHVVVTTPDLERTIAACETAGLDLRRIRDAEGNGQPMRQAFFKLGSVVLEVVSGNLGSGVPATEAPATFFGLAVDVDDLDQTAAVLGEGLGRVKTAVQRGRRIGTIRHRHVGMSVAIAAMDDHAGRTSRTDSVDHAAAEDGR